MNSKIFLSDVIFQVEDQPIYAHRAVLVQRSAHFSAMFRSGMREATERKVVIQVGSRLISTFY